MPHSNERRQQLLDMFANARVADVRDGLDSVGYRTGSVSPDIRPLFRTRIVGLALTARYLPFVGSIPDVGTENYREWAGSYYRDVCSYPWNNEISEGDVIVIDQSGVDGGLMGSENGLGVIRKGGRGIISNGGVRDTDELVLTNVPVWCRMCSQSMVQGRLQYDAHNVPVAIGSVAVNPGDVVVADGDGVIVVPHEVADDVAAYANDEHSRDMQARRRHYDALGIQPDQTVAQ